MIRLNLAQAPRWLTLGHGVEVLVDPMTAVTLAIARSHPAMDALDDDTDKDVRFAHLTNVIASLVITDWRGVGDDGGKPLEVSPEGIAALMALPQLHRAFGSAYVAPAFLVVTEKNVLSPSLNGTSLAGENTAGPV